jgi:hypothetical protein
VALFHNLRGIVVDADGGVLLADSSNHCLRKITPDGHVITFAGGWVGGWVNGWVGGWVGGWVNGWVGGWVGGSDGPSRS